MTSLPKKRNRVERHSPCAPAEDQPLLGPVLWLVGREGRVRGRGEGWRCICPTTTTSSSPAQAVSPPPPEVFSARLRGLARASWSQADPLQGKKEENQRETSGLFGIAWKGEEGAVKTLKRGAGSLSARTEKQQRVSFPARAEGGWLVGAGNLV